MDALAATGAAVDVSRIEHLARSSRSAHVRASARFALERIEVLQAPNRDERLLDALRSMRMSGELSWYHWALDHILRLGLRHLAPALRSFYDERQADLIMNGPFAFKIRLLHAIHALGGALSADELDLLRLNGRVP